MAAPRRWFRLDMDWDESDWILALDGYSASLWPRLLTWVKKRGVNGRCRIKSNASLATIWKVSEATVARLIDAALKDGALTIDGDAWVVANWELYQNPDPTASERKRKQRQRAELVNNLKVVG